VTKPSIQEIQMVYDFQHLIRCVEWATYYWKSDIDYEIDDPQDRFGENPILLTGSRQGDPLEKWPGGRDPKWPPRGWRRMPEEREPEYHTFRERLYRGLYNVLIVGAFCYGIYNEPFTQAKRENKSDFLRRCVRGSSQDLLPEDLIYLRSFPIYDFRA